MITVYHQRNDRLEKGDASALSADALWIDVLDPTDEDEAAVENLLRVDMPTPEEMQEIEASSRLYREGAAIYLTSPVLSNSDTPMPRNTPVTFILTGGCTVTVRYATPQSFTTVRRAGDAPARPVARPPRPS